MVTTIRLGIVNEIILEYKYTHIDVIKVELHT